MADSSEDELSDSSGDLSVVSDEDFAVCSSSEDSAIEDELEIEHVRAVRCTILLIFPTLL